MIKEDVVKALGELEGLSTPGKFMRKGETGDWKNKLSEEQSRRIDEWVEKQTQGSDLTYTYTL